MVTTMTTGYLEKARAAKDSEVKAWMKSNNMHLITVKVGTSTIREENRASLIRKPFYVSLDHHDEPEQDVMMNRLGQNNLISNEAENPTSILVEHARPVAADSDVLSIFSTEYVPSQDTGNRYRGLQES
jgi:hypothetical protein